MTKKEIVEMLNEAIDGLEKCNVIGEEGNKSIGFAMGVLKAVRWYLPKD